MVTKKLIAAKVSFIGRMPFLNQATALKTPFPHHKKVKEGQSPAKNYTKFARTCTSLRLPVSDILQMHKFRTNTFITIYLAISCEYYLTPLAL